MQEDGRIIRGGIGAVMPSEDKEYDWEQFWDNISGKRLRTAGVRLAREEETQEVRKHNLYDKVPIKECWGNTGRKPIGTGWVDVNKGDEVREELRSRLVAKEIKKDIREDLFSATPPLEGKKILVSAETTEGRGVEKGKRLRGKKVDFIDIRRAYFQAKARRLVYVELPPGDREAGMCGRLVKSLQGTRDAAMNWEAAYSKVLKDIGFRTGKSSPCIFYHSDKKHKSDCSWR